MPDTVLIPRDTKVTGGFYSTKDTQGNKTPTTACSSKTDNRTLKQISGNLGIREAGADLLPGAGTLKFQLKSGGQGNWRDSCLLNGLGGKMKSTGVD